MTRAVVIGGGISGLATAALLAREGAEVTLVEARDELGGRAGSWESGGFRFDTGPSWYLMPEVFDHFFRLLGTSSAEQLDLLPLDPAYRVYFEGEAEPLNGPASATRADAHANGATSGVDGPAAPDETADGALPVGKPSGLDMGALEVNGEAGGTHTSPGPPAHVVQAAMRTAPDGLGPVMEPHLQLM